MQVGDGRVISIPELSQLSVLGLVFGYIYESQPSLKVSAYGDCCIQQQQQGHSTTSPALQKFACS